MSNWPDVGSIKLTRHLCHFCIQQKVRVVSFRLFGERDPIALCRNCLGLLCEAMDQEPGSQEEEIDD